jgi:hypothetical protein
MAKFESNDFWGWLCQELAGAFGVARPQSIGGDKDRPVANSKARDDLVDWICKTPLQLMQTAARKPVLTPEMLDAVDRILLCPEGPREDSRKVFAVPGFEPKVQSTIKPTVDNGDDVDAESWTVAAEQDRVVVRFLHSEPSRDESATDYSKKSFEEGSAALERLLGARVFERAVEIQTAYAKTAYEGFVAQATKLGELYAESLVEAKCLCGLADIARVQDDHVTARGLYEQAREIYRRTGVPTGEADCLYGLADIARVQDDHVTARGLYEQAREIYQRAGHSTSTTKCDKGLSSLG